MSAKLSASLLIYDIPDDAVTPEGKPVPNPSPELWEVGCRINLSCWIVPNHLVPYGLLNDLRVAGADWEVIKFDVGEAPKLIASAAKSLRSEIRHAVSRARTAAERAAARLGNATNDDGEEPDYDKLEASYLRSARTIINRTTKAIKQFVHTAELFGIDEARLDTMHAYCAAAAIQTNAEAKARTFAAALAWARSNGYGDGDALARACEKESRVILILADWLDDMGYDTTALRHAFPIDYLDSGDEE